MKKLKLILFLSLAFVAISLPKAMAQSLSSTIKDDEYKDRVLTWIKDVQLCEKLVDPIQVSDLAKTKWREVGISTVGQTVSKTPIFTRDVNLWSYFDYGIKSSFLEIGEGGKAILAYMSLPPSLLDRPILTPRYVSAQISNLNSNQILMEIMLLLEDGTVSSSFQKCSLYKKPKVLICGMVDNATSEIDDHGNYSIWEPVSH